MRTVNELIKGTTILSEQVYEIDDNEGLLSGQAGKSLVEICRLLKIEVPIWLSKNTHDM